jgi:hypothetical protein
VKAAFIQLNNSRARKEQEKLRIIQKLYLLRCSQILSGILTPCITVDQCETSFTTPVTDMLYHMHFPESNEKNIEEKSRVF